MRRRRASLIAAGLVALAVVPTPVTAVPALPAFPGAEGFGAGATGGRGGRVVIVDTLEPFGPGSLGEALAPKDCQPRTIVFRVSGVIEVPGKHDLELSCGNVTIAGQTAPGAGITLHGRIDGFGADPAGNIIMRHLRIRPPPITTAEGAEDNLGRRYDALQLSNNPRLMLDHLSVSWGSDEVIDLHEFATDATLQWSTVEVSNPQGQPEGPHNTGMIVGPESPRVTIHHSLFAHHDARCPAMATGPAELINTIAYDCQDAFVHHNAAEGEFHIVGNTFIHGPSHEEFTPLYFDDEDPGGTTYWLSQNQIDAPGQFEGVVDDISDTPLAEAAFVGADPEAVIDTPTDFSTTSDDYAPVSVQAPEVAFEAVLDAAGAFPRDAVSLRTVAEVRDRTGSWDPDPPDDLLAGLTRTEPPTDDDRDGMADEWESDHGLDPTVGDDHAEVMASGYTAIEVYVNELSDRLVGAPPPSGSTRPASTDGEEAAETPGVRTGADPLAPVGASADDDDGSDALAGIALAVATLALALCGVSLYLVRRRTRASGP